MQASTHSPAHHPQGPATPPQSERNAGEPALPVHTAVQRRKGCCAAAGCASGRALSASVLHHGAFVGVGRVPSAVMVASLTSGHAGCLRKREGV